jgi:predicted kinase
MEVDVDHIKVALYGVLVQDEQLTQAQWNRIYADTDAQIVAHLRGGQHVVDASRHFTRAERDHLRGIVHALGYETRIIYLNTPEAIVRQRWQKNKRTQIRRDVSDHDFEAIVHGMEPPIPDEQPWIVAHGGDIEQWIAQHTTILC